MNEQKVPMLSAAQAAQWMTEDGPDHAAIVAIEAIATGAAVVIPRAELEAKDARIAELQRKNRATITIINFVYSGLESGRIKSKPVLCGVEVISLRESIERDLVAAGFQINAAIAGETK